MSGGEIIFQGWLRKSPPEKKLRRYAWKKRWFILRSGRMSGDPDVLEYYKNDHSKKPIRVIDLHCCEQVDAGLTFKRKEFQDSFVFDIKTSDRTFYLVAETEEEMNKWVRSICQLCGFNQSDDNNDSRLHHISRSVGAEAPGSVAPVSGDRKSVPIHSSQPLLFTFDVPARPLSNSAPQDYLLLHQCISRKTESARSASFSQSMRHNSNVFMGSDTAVQKLSHGFSHCLNGMGGQLHGFYSLPKPGKHHPLPVHDDSPQEACYVLPRGYSSEAPLHSNFSEPDLENEEVYTFQTPCNALATLHSNERSNDNYDLPTTPGSFYQIPRTFDKNHNALTPSSSESSSAPPPRPPKPSQGSEVPWGSPQSVGSHNGDVPCAVSVIPRRNTLPAVENIRLHRGSSFETNSHYRHTHFNNSGQSAESVLPTSSFLRTKAPLTRSDSGNSDDNYVPMNPGSSPLSAAQADSPKNIYIPMSPGPHHFDFPGFSATLPARKGSSTSLCQRPGRLSDVTPPPINRNLKPNRKSKPTPLDLKNNGIIDELPFKSPVTMSWTRPMSAMNSMSSQHCRPISTQSITSTDSADSEENYVAMNPASTSPAVSGTSSPAPRQCGNVDYLALDFQPGSPSPNRKPSTSSVTSDEKVDYVQVDKEKTQALQSTMQEWTDVRQSTEPTKGVKS
ncbi:GRB2-associated-binding protein 2 isoform X2 [Periophthalmus magnuspinnatus]|uniref:GRB2-associated-binding protein 2 isoform X2 n=1 Tax=Periophthalmus magnuspinnatus TaxID=409849 RepID=UPI00145A594B|nr:GRB2-associated-binding protein 2 isoform X2 [Periophthalmus magnuspinnatus]